MKTNTRSTQKKYPMTFPFVSPLFFLLVGSTLLFSTYSSAQSTVRLITTDNINGSLSTGATLEMEVGRSAGIRTEWNIDNVSVANPAVADIVPQGLNEVLIVSQSIGRTDLIVWGENGEIWACEINVDADPQRLNDDLSELFPTCSINVTRSEDVYFIQGIMQKSDQIEHMHKFLDTVGINYVDMTKLAGLFQVQIKVRVAEVNRTAIKRMAVNSLYGTDRFIGGSAVGSAAGGSISPIGLVHETVGSGMPFIGGVASNSPLVTLLAAFPNSDLTFFIQALAENQYLHLLAEPTLVTLSGEEANFLAGGEFPIPVGQENDVITIEFKEVGIGLVFRPEVLGDGTIRLKIDTEVSEISDFGAIELQGFKIPSIITRRVDTTLEMKSGQTFTMAGLLNHSTNVKKSRVPFLGDLPILGNLFRSTSYQLGETELVVLVTPTLVEPVSYAEIPMLPGDQYAPPNDWEFMALGQIEHTEKKSESPDQDSLSQLKGPGAWDDHQSEGDSSQ